MWADPINTEFKMESLHIRAQLNYKKISELICKMLIFTEFVNIMIQSFKFFSLTLLCSFQATYLGGPGQK